MYDDRILVLELSSYVKSTCITWMGGILANVLVPGWAGRAGSRRKGTYLFAALAL